MAFDLLLLNAKVIDGSGLPWFQADVGVSGDRIAAVGALADAEAAVRVDCTGLTLAPGLIDTHVHGDLVLLADPQHEPAVRQGVTTYVIGQDGVAFAPGSPTTRAYMRRYTAGFSGGFDIDTGDGSMASYLAQFDGRCAINACSLIPNGNVRMDVMGLETRRATAEELQAMRRLVREAMEQGAVGLSSGLDYIPSLYADQAELTELCREIAPFGGIYVTHMRGYWPHNIEASMNEVAGIGRDAGCGVHISHFNSLAEQAIPLLDAMRSRGVDTTFDLYCYVAGSTILGMVTLPPEVQGGGADATLERLRDPTTVEQLHDWWLKPRIPLDTIRLACVPHADYRQYEGRTLAQAVQERFGEVTPENLGRFVCEILVACDLAVGCVVPHFKPRSEADVKALTRHPAMMGGSDGIFIGARPHPRGTGCFARYLGPYVREGVWSLEEAIAHCSWHAARRYGLSQRGQIQPGWAADLFVFDPATIADTSTYDNGRALAVGVRDVLVNGQFVLRDGQRTSQRPGRGLKRGET